MAVHEIHIDRSRPLTEQPDVGHNRWHPDIAPIAHCRPGDEVVMESRDAVDGQITPGSTVDDVRSPNANVIHPLTGPVFVEGAEVGDLLVVDILEVVPGSFGFTLQSPGFGFLRDAFPDPFLVRWHRRWFGNDAGHSRDPHPSVSVHGHDRGGAVSRALEQHHRPRANARRCRRDRRPPGANRRRSLRRADQPRSSPHDPAARERRERGHQAAHGRSAPPPPRPGPRGALFSVGDAHFAQGDCEACGQAIEMSATLRARLDIRKGAARERGIAGLRFERHEPPPGPAEGTGDAYVATTGVCVERDGSNRSEDLTLAARNALLDMIDHITSTFGYSKQQAYALCSVAVDLKISQAVDLPNVLVSAFLPLGVSEQGVSGR
jgi:formamidase